MSRTRLWKLASILTAACLGTAAIAGTAAAQADRGNIDDQLVIASLAPETGDLSAIVDSLRVPVELAVEEINEAGGVLDADVGYVTGDDGTDAAVASVTLDRLLTSDAADAIIGPASSGTAGGLLDKIETNSAVMCTGSATSPALSPKGIGGGYFFRTAPPDKLQAPALADLVVADGFSQVAIIALNDDYGQGFAKALSKSLKQAGAKVVANVPYSPEGGPYDTDAQTAADENPDAVVLIAFPDTGATVLQAMIAAGIGPADVQIYTTDGLDASGIPAAVDPADLGVLDGVKGTTPAAAPAAVDHPFQAAFAETGVDTIFSSYYYDCTIITALAAVSAKTDDPSVFRKHFKKVLTGKKRCQTFADCKELLDNGKTINYDGASSEFQKFSDHEPLSGVYDVYGWDAAGEKSTEGDDAQISIG